jgi:hypothetical protein
LSDRDVLRLAATTVAGSLLAWWPAFTIGVYKTIFFEQIFALWAATTAAFLVAVLMLGRRAWAHPALYSLLVPSVWMLVTWLTPADGRGFGHDVLFWTGVGAALEWRDQRRNSGQVGTHVGDTTAGCDKRIYRRRSGRSAFARFGRRRRAGCTLRDD